ncbi:hypothetical protein AUP68_05710 [Ilyonectria robusta]
MFFRLEGRERLESEATTTNTVDAIELDDGWTSVTRGQGWRHNRLQGENFAFEPGDEVNPGLHRVTAGTVRPGRVSTNPKQLGLGHCLYPSHWSSRRSLDMTELFMQ